MKPVPEARKEPAAEATEKPAAPAESRGSWFGVAALGVLASAALVLLMLKVLGPDDSTDALLRPGGALDAYQGPQTSAPTDAKTADTQKKVVEAKADAKKGHESETSGREPETKKTEAIIPPPATSDAPPENAITADAAGVEASGSTGGALGGGDSAATDEEPPTRVEPKQAGPSISEQIDAGCEQVRGGNAGRGVQILKRAREERPHDIRLLTCLADGLYKIGEWRQAESAYLLLIDEYPRNKIGYLGVGMANEMQGRGDRAAIYYQQLLRLDPKNQTALNFFAAAGRAMSNDPNRVVPPR